MSRLDRILKYENERVNGKYVAKNWQRFMLWVAFGVVLVIMLIPLIGYYSISRTNRIIDIGRKVEATYLRVTFDSRRRAQLVYEYMDSDGTLYIGKGDIYFHVVDAEKHIGETTEIYIDGKGNSTDGSKRDGTWFLVGAIGCGVLAVGVLVFQIVMWDEWEKKSKALA